MLADSVASLRRRLAHPTERPEDHRDIERGLRLLDVMLGEVSQALHARGVGHADAELTACAGALQAVLKAVSSRDTGPGYDKATPSRRRLIDKLAETREGVRTLLDQVRDRQGLLALDDD
ncbi:MAG: hypothetical protein U0797_12890 [Gemmataceae bacterium]